MAYADEGAGDPVVFLHGNATSSYMWRNIMPYLEGMGRLIAIDNIGQGDSAKLKHSGPDAYTLAEHQTFIDGTLDALGVTDNVTFVMHDWGGPLGMTWAQHHPDAIKGLAYCETLACDHPSYTIIPMLLAPCSNVCAGPRASNWCWRKTFSSRRYSPRG